jgi:hypothetical protein
MAVGFGAASESHTGTTGHSGSASFTWNHDSTGDRFAVVFVVTIANLGVPLDTGVTFGGVAMTAVPGGLAVDTVGSGEPGAVRAYYLDNIVQGASTAVVVNRTNNAVVMYGSAETFTAAGACEPFGIVVQSEDGAIAQVNVDDGSPGTDSMRVACAYTGAAAPPTAGANSTLDTSIDFGAFGVSTLHETTAGQGSRPVGGVAGSDDRAYVLFAVRETPAAGGATLRLLGSLGVGT